MLWKLSPSQASGLRATQGFPLRVWPGPVGSRRNQTGRRCDDQPALPADSALEDYQVQVSRTALISAIPVRSPSHGSEGCAGPADQQLLAR